MENNDQKYEELKTKATMAYVGWRVGLDIVNPMRNLKEELENQGIDIETAIRIYKELKN